MSEALEKSPDIALVSRLRRGEERAFQELLQTYLGPVYGFLFSLTRDQAVSEDLAQETFIKAWKNLARFDAEKSLKVWLFAIAKNSAYDFFRKKKTIPFSSFEDEEGNSPLENVADEELLAHDLLMEKDTAEVLDEALSQIPQSASTLLTLRYRENLSLQEIAELLDIPYNTVKSRHSRALARLKQALKGKNASEKTGSPY